MSRSKWKVPYISNIFFSNFFLKKKKIFFWSKSSNISNFLVNKKMFIYNGIWNLSLKIRASMVGHKLGEFIMTKKLGRDIHKKKKKKIIWVI